MSWNDNPYYSPEKFGLETIGEIEWDNESYSFNLTVVWHHPETGRFFIESDSGCSCPSPFEDLRGLDDLAVYDAKSAIVEIAGMINAYNHHVSNDVLTQKTNIIGKLMGMVIR